MTQYGSGSRAPLGARCQTAVLTLSLRCLPF